MWRGELGSWTPACVVWLSGVGLLSPSGPWLCAQGPLQSLREQTRRRDEREAGIRGHRLRRIPSDSSVIHHPGGRKQNDKTHQGETCFTGLFTAFLSFLHFTLTSIFHELICFVAPPWVLLYWIHLVPIHPAHNLSITGECGKLIIYWWEGGSHEFLTAFVLFIKPDQTMKIQTSLKGKGGSRRE